MPFFDTVAARTPRGRPYIQLRSFYADVLLYVACTAVPSTTHVLSHLRLTALLITNISTLPSTSRRMRDRDAHLGLTGTPAAESTAGTLLQVSFPARTWRPNHAASVGVGCLNLLEDLKRSTRSFAGAIVAAETETQGCPLYCRTYVLSCCREPRVPAA